MTDSLFRAKAIYFLLYAAGAALSPFLPVFYRGLGFGGSQIGLLLSIGPLVALAGAPFWAGVADASQQHRRVLLAVMVGTMTAVAILSQLRLFWLLALAVAAYAFFNAPIIPLVDNSVLTLLGERRSEYGRQRLWGAVGWGLSAPVAGWLAAQFGQAWIFVVYLVLIAGTMVAASRLPIHMDPREHSYWSGVRQLLSDSRWFIFLGVILLCGIGSTVISNYLFLYMGDLGASETLMGLALTAATVGELPVLFFSGAMLRRWGPRGLLGIGMSAYVARAMGLSLAVTPWQVLALQLLHGLTFSVVWVAGVSFAGQMAPKGLGATAQGIMNSVVFGISGICGSLVGGVLFERYGGVLLFRSSALMVLAGLVIFLTLGRRLNQTSANRPAGGEPDHPI
jgi:PPP family 3-phenylpropionic acid transporter